MRLDKYITDSTDYTRSQTKKLIKLGRIQLNERLAHDPATPVAIDIDCVQLDHQTLTRPGPAYYMLHKPAGYVCSHDGDQASVLDLIALSQKQKESLQIAGRLDKDTTGLVLLTNDGPWNHRVTHPRAHCLKRYHVTLAKPLQPQLVEQFQQGLRLNEAKGEKSKPTRTAGLQIIDEYRASLALQEGRYHQVKRMFAAVGNRVLALHRDQVGPLRLDSALAEGDYRPLTDEEISYFR